MNLIEELEEKFKTKSKKGTIEEKEKIAVDFLNSVDFSIEQNQTQAKNYVKHILTDFVEKNKEITSLEAKIVHCMLARISLSNLNLKDVKVNYRDRTPEDNAGAYYSNNAINFFNQSVCNKYEWLLPYGTNNETGAQSRLNYFVHELLIIEHEIQHAVQFYEMDKSEKNPDKLTVDDYIISRQFVARLFASSKGTKYFKQDLSIDRLYDDNHDQFYYEIDADINGLERSLELLKEISPQAYELAIDEKIGWSFLSKLEGKKSQLVNYSDITWEHNTNPENVKVSANHKASMIIDNILPQLSMNERKEFMQKYPALQITHNFNGTRKSLEQIEKEFYSKKSNLLINGTDEQIRTNMPNFIKLYESAIESDPVLSFERCLQHIARLSYDSDRYFTDSGMGVKYNPKELRKELALAKQKAIKISIYLEDSQAKDIKKIFDKYKNEIFANKKFDPQSLRFFEDKKLAIYEIESTIYHNIEVRNTIKKDKLELSAKRKQKQLQRVQAEELIKKIFPNFNPNPQLGTINNGNIEFKNNVNEKLMLMEAYKQYVRTITKNSNLIQSKDFVPSGKLLEAIKSLYDFTITEEEQQQFDAMLTKQEIKVVKNKYQTSPDQESDAEKARFKSQRQVYAQNQQEKLNKKTVRPLNEDEIEQLKQDKPDVDYEQQREQSIKEEKTRMATKPNFNQNEKTQEQGYQRCR